jgi:hypothetical protein
VGFWINYGECPTEALTALQNRFGLSAELTDLFSQVSRGTSPRARSSGSFLSPFS